MVISNSPIPSHQRPGPLGARRHCPADRARRSRAVDRSRKSLGAKPAGSIAFAKRASLDGDRRAGPRRLVANPVRRARFAPRRRIGRRRRGNRRSGAWLPLRLFWRRVRPFHQHRPDQCVSLVSRNSPGHRLRGVSGAGIGQSHSGAGHLPDGRDTRAWPAPK